MNSWRQIHCRDHTQVTDQAGAVYPCVLGSIYLVIQVELVTDSLRPTPTPWVTTHSLDYFVRLTVAVDSINPESTAFRAFTVPSSQVTSKVNNNNYWQQSPPTTFLDGCADDRFVKYGGP